MVMFATAVAAAVAVAVASASDIASISRSGTVPSGSQMKADVS